MMVILAVSAVMAAVTLTPTTTYSGTAHLNNSTIMLFLPDTFEVVFDNVVIGDYQVVLEGFSTPIQMIWEADYSAGYGAGQLEKDCYVTEKTPTGFKGVCNYRMYQVGMAYSFIGEYQNYGTLERNFAIKGLGESAFQVDWIMSVKEENTTKGGLMR